MRNTHQEKIVFKIQVAVKVNNYWQKQICKIIFRDDNTLKHISSCIRAFDGSQLVLENNVCLPLTQIVDIKF